MKEVIVSLFLTIGICTLIVLGSYEFVTFCQDNKDTQNVNVKILCWKTNTDIEFYNLILDNL